MKTELSDYIDRKSEFSKMTLTEQVKYMIFFYIKISRDPIVSTKNIEDMFILACLPTPSNISVFFGTLQKRKILIKQKLGYTLHRDVLSELEAEFPENIPKIQTSTSLRTLTSKVTGDDLKHFLEEAILCYECSAYRAAIIMVWVSTMDHVYDYIMANKLSDFNIALKAKNIKKLPVVNSKDDFSDLKESDFIEICRSARIITNDQRKILDEKLGIRNSCAHPNKVVISESKATNFVEDLIQNIILQLK